jgi:hypothetical protein
MGQMLVAGPWKPAAGTLLVEVTGMKLKASSPDPSRYNRARGDIFEVPSY